MSGNTYVPAARRFRLLAFFIASIISRRLLRGKIVTRVLKLIRLRSCGYFRSLEHDSTKAKRETLMGTIFVRSRRKKNYIYERGRERERESFLNATFISRVSFQFLWATLLLETRSCVILSHTYIQSIRGFFSHQTARDYSRGWKREKLLCEVCEVNALLQRYNQK